MSSNPRGVAGAGDTLANLVGLSQHACETVANLVGLSQHVELGQDHRDPAVRVDGVGQLLYRLCQIGCQRRWAIREQSSSTASQTQTRRNAHKAEERTLLV